MTRDFAPLLRVDPFHRALCLVILPFLAWTNCCAQAPARSALTVQAAPERPIIETDDAKQFLNFDLIFKNQSLSTVRISGIRLDVYDSSRHLVLRKALNTDAFAPSITVIGKQTLAPADTTDIFNPFFEFDAGVSLTQLEFSFCLLRESTENERQKNLHRLPDDCDFRQQVTVWPRVFQGKTQLVLPLRGKIFVWEGHDYYAHHFRVPLGSPKIQALGITANSNEFASDFIYLDEQGRAYHDDPRKLENWYSYGKPIYAPGAGVVMAAANDIPDNWFEDENASRIGYPKLPVGKDPKDIGNFVLIDHKNGEFSLLVHMKPGTVTVRPGEPVSQGQQLGQIGFAGDAIFPHLHYSLMDGPEVFRAWGLPATFSRLRRMFGTTAVELNHAPVNSGEFLESTATK